MVVTGDRDAYQLVDDGTVRIMTTSRGITDTRVYDREGVIDRYGIPPELIPDFIGLKGDTSDNIPGVPGIGDKTAAELLQRFGSLENVLDSVDEISGAKRKQNLTEHADDARVSKQLATAKRDITLEHRPRRVRRPPSPTARSCARRSAVRAPRAAAPARGGARVGRRGRPAPVAEAALARAAGEDGARDRASAAATTRWRSRSGRPRRPRARCSRARRRGGSASTRTGPRSLAGGLQQPEELVEALGDRPGVAHDAKALGEVPGRRSRTTPRSPPTCSSRPAAATRSASCARSAGFGADVEDRAAADAAARARAAPPGSARRSRGRGLTELLTTSSCRWSGSCARWSRPGSSSTPSGWRRSPTRVKAEADALEREIFELAGEEFTIGSPQQLEEILFGKLGLSRKRRGKTGYSTDARVLQAIRHEHPIIPKIERWRELTKLAQTYLDALPLLIAADGRLHTTFNQTAATTGRLSSNNPNLQNIPIRTRARARDPRLLRRRARQPARVGRLLAGRAAAARPHRRRGRAQGDLPPRRGRPHRHGLSRVRA